MNWQRSHRFDPRAVALADRHYSRQKPGTPQFMPAGRTCVLYGEVGDGRAVWGVSWQFPEYVDHAWPGAWVCSIFRNEGLGKASLLITTAVAATRAHFGSVPDRGIITFVDPSKVRPKGNPGHCFIIAGFRPCGITSKGLIVLGLPPDRMPPAAPALRSQLALFGGIAA